MSGRSKGRMCIVAGAGETMDKPMKFFKRMLLAEFFQGVRRTVISYFRRGEGKYQHEHDVT